MAKKRILKHKKTACKELFMAPRGCPSGSCELNRWVVLRVEASNSSMKASTCSTCWVCDWWLALMVLLVFTISLDAHDTCALYVAVDMITNLQIEGRNLYKKWATTSRVYCIPDEMINLRSVLFCKLSPKSKELVFQSSTLRSMGTLNPLSRLLQILQIDDFLWREITPSPAIKVFFGETGIDDSV